jgi:urocanate hydratase
MSTLAVQDTEVTRVLARNSRYCTWILLEHSHQRSQARKDPKRICVHGLCERVYLLVCRANAAQPGERFVSMR